eukprot:12212159-Karenia_brevis.AAC.1
MCCVCESSASNVLCECVCDEIDMSEMWKYQHQRSQAHCHICVGYLSFSALCDMMAMCPYMTR